MNRRGFARAIVGAIGVAAGWVGIRRRPGSVPFELTDAEARELGPRRVSPMPKLMRDAIEELPPGEIVIEAGFGGMLLSGVVREDKCHITTMTKHGAEIETRTTWSKELGSDLMWEMKYWRVEGGKQLFDYRSHPGKPRPDSPPL